MQTDVYYFMPQIYDVYGHAYDRDAHGRWHEYITSLNLGVVSYCVVGSMGYQRVRSDYYRVDDAQRFLVTAMQLGIVIDEDTPYIPPDHGQPTALQPTTIYRRKQSILMV